MQLMLGTTVIAELPEEAARALIALASNPGRFMRVELDPMYPPSSEERNLAGSSLKVLHTRRRVDASIGISFTVESDDHFGNAWR